MPFQQKHPPLVGDLLEANLSRAALRGSNLSYTRLTEMSFDRPLLEEARLDGADL